MDLKKFSSTLWADLLDREQIMDYRIRPLWDGMPRIAGPAYPVACAPGDNLMLHAAIYRAPKGAVVVAKAGDLDYALAGGNVCATAQKNGIAGFVIDGLVRDIAEIRDCGFPVFARGLIPKPGSKQGEGILNGTITCGGVKVSPGDWVVADEEGIVLIPEERLVERYEAAVSKDAKDKAQSPDQWEESHRATVDAILASKGLT